MRENGGGQVSRRNLANTTRSRPIAYRAGVETLSRRALNRATLERQHLLAFSDRSVAEMLEHLVGMQAQNPLDPYYGLWARLQDFDPAVLARMTTEREVVRGQFMRGTIHLFTADGAVAVHPLTKSVLERVFRSTQFSKDIAGVDLELLLSSGREQIEERPRTRAELARELTGMFPGVAPGSLAQAVTYLTPVAQVPPRGVWGSTGPAAWAPIDAFLGRPYGDGISVDDLMIRYLAAFGPAGVKDMRVWSGLSGLSEIFDRLRPRLRTYRDEDGAELFDLPEIELPDPETPAPPRLLPEYDNVLLGHSDRSRFFEGDAVPPGWVGNVLVDGVYSGSWKRTGRALEVSLTERGLADEEAVHVEATRLAGMAWPGEVIEIRFERS
ncbi:MAG TPA: winged helix DNA-binding domain-containing protein [Acidimicrobiia bacterium]|nr:winged helix DNA-binding domain-containing protein [Acidimicrobiia bacterium]